MVDRCVCCGEVIPEGIQVCQNCRLEKGEKMYRSPIETFITDILNQIEKQHDDEVYKAVVSIGINVDKDELIRALKYDRQQYEKGRLDGEAEAMASIIRCKDCDSYCPETNDRPICLSWGCWCDPDGWCYKGERREGE